VSALPAVSLIILNYNGRAYLDRSLQSALALEYPSDQLEIILCDNGSSDGSVDYVRTRYAGVRVVPLEQNHGFAEGNNRAVEAARHEWIAFVNNDMWFKPGWLRDFVSAAADYPAVECFTCRIMNWKGTAIDFIGGAVNFEGHGFQLDHGAPASSLDRERRVIAPCGGAMLIRRDLFQRIGGFDPLYFSFFEDTDLGWRLNLLGHEVLYTPRATTYHREHATARKFPTNKLRVLYERNALFTIYKCLDEANLALALPAALLLSNERALRLARISIDAFRIGPEPPVGQGLDPLAAPTAANSGSLAKKSREAVREAGWYALVGKAASYLSTRALRAARRPLLHGGDFLPSISLSHYVAMHEFALRLPTLIEKRRWLQANRVRSDAELMPLFAEPLRPTWDDPEYVRFHGWLSQTLGLQARFATPAETVKF
jgi:GT2 family glycosyltransferase